MLTYLERKLPSVYSFGKTRRHEWVAEQASTLPANAKILDVGAGPCRYRDLFNHCEYLSQDFASYKGSNMGDKLGSDFETWKYGKLDYICDATNIPVADGEFDAILCTEVLEHVPEPVKVLEEFSRILKEGGVVLITAPLGSGLHQEPYHFYGGYTPHWYKHFLGNLGFGNLSIIANGGFFRNFGQESQRFASLVNPFKTKGMNRIVLIPVWLLAVPLFRFVMPMLCHYLDRFDVHRGFTVGYHVTAVKLVTGKLDDRS